MSFVFRVRVSCRGVETLTRYSHQCKPGSKHAASVWLCSSLWYWASYHRTEWTERQWKDGSCTSYIPFCTIFISVGQTANNCLSAGFLNRRTVDGLVMVVPLSTIQTFKSKNAYDHWKPSCSCSRQQHRPVAAVAEPMPRGEHVRRS